MYYKDQSEGTIKTYASNEPHHAHLVYELFHIVVALESILHWCYISDAKNGLIGVSTSLQAVNRAYIIAYIGP